MYLEWGPVCGHWTSPGPKSQVCSSTKGLPIAPSAGEVAPASSHLTCLALKSTCGGPSPSNPLAGTRRGTCHLHPPFSCICLPVPASLGMMVPEDPTPTPSQTLDIPSCGGSESPPLHCLGVLRMTDSERSTPPHTPAYRGSQPHSHPPVFKSPTTGD